MAAFCVAAPGWAGAAPDPAHPAHPTDPCLTAPCRAGGYSVRVRGEGAHYTLVGVRRSPYVLPDGAILIFPGETLVFAFAPDGDMLGAPRFVAEYAPQFPAERDTAGDPTATPPLADLPKLAGGLPRDMLAKFPPGTVIVSYGQSAGQSGMNLTLMSNLAKTMKLDAVIALIASGGYDERHASTCPVLPNLIDDENWAQPLGPMLLTNFRFQPAGGGMVCD
ncbi:MAG TPA: hypothetical protein VNU97_17735 [Rhizomicrobium sp.]|nr:hypothetical protein [Rhizomicrobium sp.]